MSKLKKVNELYKKYIILGYGQYEAAECSVFETFDGSQEHPHIECDENGEKASHIFFGDKVLFFGKGIYKLKNI